MTLMFRKALLATALVAGLFASAVFAAQVVDEVSQVPHYDQA
jgi:opacity protein-like surface antigen